MIWLLILVSAAAAAQPANDAPVLHVFTYDLAGIAKGALAAHIQIDFQVPADAALGEATVAVVSEL